MENTKKEMKQCGCCPAGCMCGDCDCCKAGNSCEKGCCGSNVSCALPNGGCRSCSNFRSYCLLCKLGKVLFGLLIILALAKIAFGGFGMNRRDKDGCGCGGGGCSACGAGMNSGAMAGKMNCMGMKGEKAEKGNRKSWFNRGENDNDDAKLMSGAN